ncbi:MAG: acyl--CoA ligase [Lachnospiraceae bacterium]|nr:acyl--CoA ligase [Lachnospiraceae bacterium]
MNSMVEILHNHALRQPDRLFAADAGSSYTYKEAWDKIRDIAFYLSDCLGIGRSDLVMAECGQDAAYLILDMACELIGAVFVPVENEASEDRIRLIHEETGSVLAVFCEKEYDGIRSVSYDELLGCPHTEYDGFTFPEADCVAEILYTTGTTGRSKGIVISHRANIALAENIRYGVNMKPGNTELIPVAISHSHGIRCCYANLLNGGSIILSDGLIKIRQVLDMIEKYNVTALDLSPNAAILLIKLSKGQFWEYGKKLDYIQIGTASLPEGLKNDLISNLPGVRLYNFYGSTESGRTCVLEFSSVTGRENCIGLPTKNSQIIFTDDDAKPKKATREDPGLLASKGPMNMECYFRNPELTASVLKDGYIVTSDLGYIDDEGYVYVFGRKDDVINCNGINISPDEIEDVALKSGLAADAACIPVSDELKGQVPKLYIVTKDNAELDVNALSEYLNGHLDKNKLPKYIERIDSIPRTSNGKIQRRLLK